MKAKQKVSVGIDGITCIVSGVFVLDEIHYPRESLKPILKITPKNKTTEIGIILPHYIYDTDTQDENNKKVLNALGNGGESTKFNEYDSTNVRQREIKIIPFHKKEKAENPIKYKAFHS